MTSDRLLTSQSTVVTWSTDRVPSLPPTQDHLRLHELAHVEALGNLILILSYPLLILLNFLFPQLHTTPSHAQSPTPSQQRILLETSRKPLPSHHVSSLSATKTASQWDLKPTNHQKFLSDLINWRTWLQPRTVKRDETGIFLKDPGSDPLYRSWNSAQSYVAAWMGGSLGENGYMYADGWVPSLFTWNCQNIVNQLCSCY